MKDIKDMTQNENVVFKSLPIGNKNPITSKELNEKTGLTQRRVMDIINRLIMDYHVPIVADRTHEKRGYYIARNNSELQTGIKSLFNQVTENIKRVDLLVEIDVEKRLKELELNYELNKIMAGFKMIQLSLKELK